MGVGRSVACGQSSESWADAVPVTNVHVAQAENADLWVIGPDWQVNLTAVRSAARDLLSVVDPPGWGTYFQPQREHLRAALDGRAITDDQAWEEAKHRAE